MTPRTRPNGPLSLVIVIWGFNFVSLKLLYPEMEPGAVAVIRFTLMWIVLWAICLVTKRIPKIERVDRARILFAGFMSMGMYMVLFLAGMAQTTPAEGAIVLATAPVLTYVLAVALKWERWIRAAMAGTLVAFLGVGLIVAAGTGGHGTPLGNGLVLASAVMWAISTLVMRPLVGKYDPLAVLTYSMPGALPPLLIYGGLATARFDPARLTWIGWANLAQVVLFSGVIAFLAFYKGLNQVGPAVATSYQFGVPVMAAFFGWLVFGRALAPIQWLGVASVIGGVATSSWARARAAR